MLEAYMNLLQVSLEYLEEEHDIIPSQVSQVEIEASGMEYFAGSVLFPEHKLEAFLMPRPTRVYHTNQY